MKRIQTKKRCPNPNDIPFREPELGSDGSILPASQIPPRNADFSHEQASNEAAHPPTDWDLIPLNLRSKGSDVRIDSVVSGTLSRWSCEIGAGQAQELFCIQWDEATGKFRRSEELAKLNYVTSLEAATAKRNDAASVFATVAEKRSALGMVGGVVSGADCAELPDTTAEKMRMVPNGFASSGPIRSTITERLPTFQAKDGHTHSAEILARIFEQIGYRGRIQTEKNKLQFDFIGTDDKEEDVFYFAQRRSVNPNRDGPVKWRLKCSRDTVWRSAAPRPYGPGREWGGPWGGGVLPFANHELFHQPGATEEMNGGTWEPCQRYVLSVIDEGRPEQPFQPFEPGPTLSATGTLSGSYMPHFSTGRTVAPHSKVVPRTIAPRGLKNSYRVQHHVQVGLPPCGYPGWSNRHNIPQPSSSFMMGGRDSVDLDEERLVLSPWPQRQMPGSQRGGSSGASEVEAQGGELEGGGHSYATEASKVGAMRAEEALSLQDGDTADGHARGFSVELEARGRRQLQQPPPPRSAKDLVPKLGIATAAEHQPRRVPQLSLHHRDRPGSREAGGGVQGGGAPGGKSIMHTWKMPPASHTRPQPGMAMARDMAMPFS